MRDLSRKYPAMHYEKERHLLKKITRNIVLRTMMPLYPSPWDLTEFSQLPSHARSYFPESRQQSENSSLSKVILVLGKARSHGAPNLGCRGPESPWWFDISPKNSSRDVMHEQACCPWWSCQSPVAHNCSLLSHPNSCHPGMFKPNAKFVADLLLYSLSHFECYGHTIDGCYLIPESQMWTNKCLFSLSD